MTEYSMPRSSIRHRPIYSTSHVVPVTQRVSKSLPRTTTPATTTTTLHKLPISWLLPFIVGMGITLAILLIGHLSL